MTIVMQHHALDRLSRSGLTSDDLRDLPMDPSGWRAVDRLGNELGVIEDALIDPVSLRAPFLVLGSGGLFGIGRQERLVPLASIARLDRDGVVVDRDRDLVLGAPQFRDDFPDDEVEDHYSVVNSRYGVVPHWGVPASSAGRGYPEMGHASSLAAAEHGADDHPRHDPHLHVHAPGCGHETRRHGDHEDYEHDGHWHARHGDHYDEHGEDGL